MPWSQWKNILYEGIVFQHEKLSLFLANQTERDGSHVPTCSSVQQRELVTDFLLSETFLSIIHPSLH